MYQVIARKYRPQTFAELIGQEHVRTTIENAIAQRRIAHGYIFAGQRGTGKTTVARILARCLNCVNGPTPQPCGVCASCIEISAGNSMDVIEIDAASNRGINEMRELRENVRFRPARDRYKVFIIDEAHQITSEAFNALLKTLEEPPEWVVFILCTTEVHKIPTTIASRCQQFTFRSVDFAEVVNRMTWICEQEGVAADADVLAVLAQAGEGSVRDSLSALDQAIACCGERLAAEQVRQLLGMFSLDSLAEVSQALANADGRRALEVVLDLERNGRNLQHFCRELGRYFRNLLVVKVAGSGTRLVAATGQEQERLAEIARGFSEEDLTRFLKIALDLFTDMQTSLQPRLHLELGLLRLVHAGKIHSIEEVLAGLGNGGEAPLKAAAPKAAVVTQATPAVPASKPEQTPPAPSRPLAKAASPSVPAERPSISETVVSSPAEGSWRDRLYNAVNNLGLTYSADALEMAEVSQSGNELIVTIPEGYLLDGADVRKALQHLGEKPMKVTIKTGTPPRADLPKPKAPAADEVSERALSHPEVKRFQELFPDAQVRAVRNLKE